MLKELLTQSKKTSIFHQQHDLFQTQPTSKSYLLKFHRFHTVFLAHQQHSFAQVEQHNHSGVQFMRAKATSQASNEVSYSNPQIGYIKSQIGFHMSPIFSNIFPLKIQIPKMFKMFDHFEAKFIQTLQFRPIFVISKSVQANILVVSSNLCGSESFVQPQQTFKFINLLIKIHFKRKRGKQRTLVNIIDLQPIDISIKFFRIPQNIFSFLHSSNLLSLYLKRLHSSTQQFSSCIIESRIQIELIFFVQSFEISTQITLNQFNEVTQKHNWSKLTLLQGSVDASYLEGATLDQL
ncbi:unnamed protein product [Paramecium primaurelia]|uniref:Uncharacterized protein n=1 Tax=Paramecium primaurelia TaxID=5886 RepID=A0A8S1QRP1_PARPR|nr:unnamed protein product [Paramecium primaurelia]